MYNKKLSEEDRKFMTSIFAEIQKRDIKEVDKMREEDKILKDIFDYIATTTKDNEVVKTITKTDKNVMFSHSYDRNDNILIQRNIASLN